MAVLYSVGISLLRLLYWFASWFHPKAKSFVTGRRLQRQAFQATFPLPSHETLVWFHCASLGEFEQGRPVIEALKTWKPTLKILLTFFSPSGYEVRKNFELADFVFYLPWDTRTNARRFVELARPSLAVFVKYEFWYHYSSELRTKGVPLVSISAIFRREQVFFRSHGSIFRATLKNFSHFFVQNNASVELLHSIGITSASLAGDTRFDRVNQLTQKAEEIPMVHDFKDGKRLMVIGSAWPDDMDVLYPFINENKGSLKFIIAPHEINKEFLATIERTIESRTVRYSTAEASSIALADVLLIDNVGLLSRLYRYSEFAFIGGAFREGLHNILEAACYGIPVFFGNKAYQKYEEAVQLIALGGAFEVGNFVEMRSAYNNLAQNADSYHLAAEVTRQYVRQNLGATEKIMKHLKEVLK